MRPKKLGYAMNDLVVFELLKDKTIPAKVREELKKAFDNYDAESVENIIHKIMLVKTTKTLLNVGKPLVEKKKSLFMLLPKRDFIV